MPTSILAKNITHARAHTHTDTFVKVGISVTIAGAVFAVTEAESESFAEPVVFRAAWVVIHFMYPTDDLFD